MALNPHELHPADPIETPTFRTPLGTVRSQAMQRLQVGLFGLAAMLLLVGLANIIRTNVQRNDALVVPEAVPTLVNDSGAAAASDPLADAGVVPDMPAQGAQDDAAAATGDVAPSEQP